ncbi:MAG TPA: hypothetical protein VJY39_06805 [Acidisphaera sp.]|nr:hypothetical protein [Acidisphaera sp.]
MVLRVALASLVLAAAPAGDQSAQLSGLFMQACVQQPNAHAMRAWAAAHSLKPLPGDAQDSFLGGQPGVAYDATDAAGKFVLAVRDNSNCAAFADHAQADALAANLEPLLTQAGATWTVVQDAPDPQNHELHERSYTLMLGGQPYRLLIGTTEGGGQAMLGLSLQ